VCFGNLVEWVGAVNHRADLSLFCKIAHKLKIDPLSEATTATRRGL
jgi:hypothetical protein